MIDLVEKFDYNIHLNNQFSVTGDESEKFRRKQVYGGFYGQHERKEESKSHRCRDLCVSRYTSRRILFNRSQNGRRHDVQDHDGHGPRSALVDGLFNYGHGRVGRRH